MFVQKYNLFISLIRILKVLLRGIRVEEEVEVGVVAHLTPGYVGADLSALVREAAMAAVNRLLVTPSHTPSGHAHSLTAATLDITQLDTLAVSSDDFKVQDYEYRYKCDAL